MTASLGDGGIILGIYHIGQVRKHCPGVWKVIGTDIYPVRTFVNCCMARTANEQEGTRFSVDMTGLSLILNLIQVYHLRASHLFTCNTVSLGNFGNITEGVSAGAGGKKKTRDREAEESLLYEGEDEISHDLGVPLISTTPPEKPLIMGGNRWESMFQNLIIPDSGPYFIILQNSLMNRGSFKQVVWNWGFQILNYIFHNSKFSRLHWSEWGLSHFTLIFWSWPHGLLNFWCF